MATNVAGIVGSSPLNAAEGFVTRQFSSLLHSNFRNGSGDVAIKGITTTRGYLISKRELSSFSSESLLMASQYSFQFNPSQILDNKTVKYGTINYPGVDYVDYVWLGGSERTINFTLFLDDTPGSHTAMLEGKSTEEETSAPRLVPQQSTRGREFKQNVLNAFGIQQGSKAEISIEASKISGLKTRCHTRGVLDAVERIKQYLYPAPIKQDDGSYPPPPQFSTGGIVPLKNTRFRPPEILVFSYGPNYYLEGFLKSASCEYTLFDRDLTPLRAYMDIEFSVIDSYQPIKQFGNK